MNFARHGKWGSFRLKPASALRAHTIRAIKNANVNLNEEPYRMDIRNPQIYNSSMALMLSKNRMLGGVCGGLAEWLGWDPTLVRILYTLLTIFTAFSGLIVYLVLWIIMPRRT